MDITQDVQIVRESSLSYAVVDIALAEVVSIADSCGGPRRLLRLMQKLDWLGLVCYSPTCAAVG